MPFPISPISPTLPIARKEPTYNQHDIMSKLVNHQKMKSDFYKQPNSKVEYDSQGNMLLNITILKTGVFKYLVKKSQGQPDVSMQVKLPEDWLTEDVLKSVNGKPVTMQHPYEVTYNPDDMNVNPDNYSKFVKGVCIDPKIVGNTIMAKALIYDKELQSQIIDKKLIEISVGFTSYPQPKTGFYQGQAYDVIQKLPRINHVAFVKTARGGKDLKAHLDSYVFLDSVTFYEDIDKKNDSENNYKKSLDYLTIKKYDNQNKVIGENNIMIKTLKDVTELMKSKIDSCTDEEKKFLKQVEAYIDSEEKNIKEKNDMSEKDMKEFKDMKDAMSKNKIDMGGVMEMIKNKKDSGTTEDDANKKEKNDTDDDLKKKKEKMDGDDKSLKEPNKDTKGDKDMNDSLVAMIKELTTKNKVLENKIDSNDKDNHDIMFFREVCIKNGGEHFIDSSSTDKSYWKSKFVEIVLGTENVVTQNDSMDIDTKVEVAKATYDKLKSMEIGIKEKPIIPQLDSSDKDKPETTDSLKKEISELNNKFLGGK